MQTVSQRLNQLSLSARLKLAYVKVLGLRRSDYKETWNRISTTKDLAMIGVAGTANEADFLASGEVTAKTLQDALGISSEDRVLEIGCGVGRIGKSLAPHCGRWVGCDISGEMLRAARKNLSGEPNVELTELPASDLSPFGDSSFNKIYCSAVFMHLDEWDRYRYVEEAFRVLRPGGRCYFDNINLGGKQGWEIFLRMAQHPPALRPPNISKASTGEELRIYLSRAGFADVQVYPGDHFVAAVGTKPGQPA